MSVLQQIFYVYVLFRPWDGSPFYVGKGKGERWRDHERPSENHPNRYLMNIVKKAKLSGLEIPKIKVRDCLTETQAFEIERALIAAIGRGKDGPLANMTDGGDGTSGFKQSAATRAKRSAAMIGNKNPAGFKHTEETLAKLRAINSNRSPETRAKIRAANLGKKLTDEHRAKLRTAHLGKSLKPEHVSKILATKRLRRISRINADNVD